MAATVTMSEIGKRAGVTKATVSYVLNNKAEKMAVSKQTCKKVTKIAQEMGYATNHIARCFREKKSHTVCMLSSSRNNFYSPLRFGAERLLKETSYLSYLLDADDIEDLERAIRLFTEHRVDGILLLGHRSHGEEEFFGSVLKRNVPIVFLHGHYHDSRIPCVEVDNVKGGLLATQHLISLGHRRIAFITGPLHNLEAQQRYNGYRQALEQAEISLDSTLVVECGWHHEDGYQALNRLLRETLPPTAVFCFSDLIAYGALKAAFEVGVSVPKDISIIGFDDRDYSECSCPALTTIRQPGEKIGYEGAKLLVNMLENSEMVVKPVVFEPELILRDSTRKLTFNA